MTAKDSESSASDQPLESGESRGGMLKLGAVAVASALIGGIAAAWWYRKTLQKLHETGESSGNPHFGMDPDGASEETIEES